MCFYMNIMAVYHANRLSAFEGAEGLTTIRKGRHLMSAGDVRSEGELMAAAVGWMRNRTRLARELGYGDGARCAELVIGAYRRWGTEYPEHIEGPLASVVIDRSAERLVAARDRMGERRLFYCRHVRTVAVADHPDALIESPYASRTVDADGLNELFALGPARTPGRTPYRDVKALEPGCMLVADRAGVQQRRYYALEAYLNEDDADTAAEKVRGMLECAVGDVLPFANAAMLSGGLDSTALTVLMHAAGHAPRTFSVDYEGDADDFTGNAFQPERDREYAALAAELFSAGHTNIILGHEELCRSLGAAVDARGFPGMADVDSSLLLFAREFSGAIGDIVSGECSDEVFCGYPWFAEEEITLEGGFPWSGSMELRRAILKKDAAEILRPERYAFETFRNALETAPRVIGECEADAKLRALQWLCFRFFMSNLQERALCMCEASAVNVYTPFCDERLAEYVWNTPGKIKFMGGERKGLLRAAMKDLLPEKLLRRKKSPYPKVYSAQYTHSVKQAIMDMLSDSASPVMRVLDADVIRRLCSDELPANGLPWFGQLMSGPQMLAYIWQVNEWMRARKIDIAL